MIALRTISASPLPARSALCSAALLEVRDKFDGATLASLPLATAEEARAAMAAARALFRDRSAWLPKAERIGILRRAAALIHARREELALQAAAEGGKPLADSLVEIDRAADGVENCVEVSTLATNTRFPFHPHSTPLARPTKVLRSEGGLAIPMRVNGASAHKLAVTTLEPTGPVLAVSGHRAHSA